MQESAPKMLQKYFPSISRSKLVPPEKHWIGVTVPLQTRVFPPATACRKSFFWAGSIGHPRQKYASLCGSTASQSRSRCMVYCILQGRFTQTSTQVSCTFCKAPRRKYPGSGIGSQNVCKVLSKLESPFQELSNNWAVGLPHRGVGGVNPRPKVPTLISVGLLDSMWVYPTELLQ